MPSVPPRPPSVETRLRTLMQTLQERRARTAADRALAGRLRAAFAASPLGALGVSFYVHDGAIAVYGAVADEATREAVLTLAAEQPGCRRLTDALTVGV